MGFLKNLFGEKLPIQELYVAQNRLERHRISMLCRERAHIATGVPIREFELRDELMKFLGDRFASVRPHVLSGPDLWKWDRAKVNSTRWISRGNSLAIEIVHQKEFGPESHIGRLIGHLEGKYDGRSPGEYLIRCRSEIAPILTDINVLMGNRKTGSGEVACLSMALAYLEMHPEARALVSPEALASLLFDEDLFSKVGDCREWSWVQTESYVVGESINSLVLKRHEAVVEGLCAALEGLEDRGRVETYEQLDSIVRGKIADLGQEKYAYWQGRIEDGKTVRLPLGFFVGKYGPGEPISGPIEDLQAITLCPTVYDVRYGVSVVVTRDGWARE